MASFHAQMFLILTESKFLFFFFLSFSMGSKKSLAEPAL
jgi:hypothetical protein